MYTSDMMLFLLNRVRVFFFNFALDTPACSCVTRGRRRRPCLWVGKALLSDTNKLIIFCYRYVSLKMFYVLPFCCCCCISVGDVGCKICLNRLHPEDQSRTCISWVKGQPFAEATDPEALVQRTTGGHTGKAESWQRLPDVQVASEEAASGFLGHLICTISNANASGLRSLSITVNFWHTFAGSKLTK